MSNQRIERRLAALERQQVVTQDTTTAAAARFWAKLDDLAARVQHEPEPATASQATRIAWLMSRDPDAAITELQAAARAALARQGDHHATN